MHNVLKYSKELCFFKNGIGYLKFDNFGPWVAVLFYSYRFFVDIMFRRNVSTCGWVQHHLEQRDVLNFNRTFSQPIISCFLSCTVKLYKKLLFVADVNECQTGQAVCGAGEECINKLGSYDCVCPVGTTGPECSISE